MPKKKSSKDFTPVASLLADFEEARKAYIICSDAPRATQLKLSKALNNAHKKLESTIHILWCDAFEE